MDEIEESGIGIFIKESWRIEVDRNGGASVTIYTTIKNVSEKEQSLKEPYELRFRAEDQPDYIQCDGHTITDNSIPLNLTIQPSNKKNITVDLRYTSLAKKEDSWWDISLDPRYGVLSPHNLTIKIYLPMEAQEIMDRHPIPEDFLINHEQKTAVKTFNGPQYFFKLAYRLGAPETGLEERTREPLSEQDLRSVREAMPLLQTFANSLSGEQGGNLFNGMTFLIALHFLKDLIIFLESCEKLGLEPGNCYLFWKDYLYPHKDVIISYLEDLGYNVYPLTELRDVLQSQQNSMNDVLVLEDGGYIVPLLHNSFRNILEKTIGAVEQTTKGIRRDREVANLAIPVLNVAEAEIKKCVEPPYVADAAVHNIEALLPDSLRGKEIALMGLGAIGREILERLKNQARITVYDPDTIRRIEARGRGSVSAVGSAADAVRNKFLVIGSSGETSIKENEIRSLQHDTYLVSVSSDQVEIDINCLEDSSGEPNDCLKDSNKIGKSYELTGGRHCKVHLLADGYPVNFWNKDSMPNQVSDLILSIIFLSAVELVKQRNEDIKGIQNVDTIVIKYGIAERYEKIHYP